MCDEAIQAIGQEPVEAEVGPIGPVEECKGCGETHGPKYVHRETIRELIYLQQDIVCYKIKCQHCNKHIGHVGSICPGCNSRISVLCETCAMDEVDGMTEEGAPHAKPFPNKCHCCTGVLHSPPRVTSFGLESIKKRLNLEKVGIAMKRDEARFHYDPQTKTYTPTMTAQPPRFEEINSIYTQGFSYLNPNVMATNSLMQTRTQENMASIVEYGYEPLIPAIEKLLRGYRGNIPAVNRVQYVDHLHYHSACQMNWANLPAAEMAHIGLLVGIHLVLLEHAATYAETDLEDADVKKLLKLVTGEFGTEFDDMGALTPLKPAQQLQLCKHLLALLHTPVTDNAPLDPMLVKFLAAYPDNPVSIIRRYFCCRNPNRMLFDTTYLGPRFTDNNPEWEHLVLSRQRICIREAQWVHKVLTQTYKLRGHGAYIALSPSTVGVYAERLERHLKAAEEQVHAASLSDDDIDLTEEEKRELEADAVAARQDEINIYENEISDGEYTRLEYEAMAPMEGFPHLDYNEPEIHEFDEALPEEHPALLPVRLTIHDPEGLRRALMAQGSIAEPMEVEYPQEYIPEEQQAIPLIPEEDDSSEAYYNPAVGLADDLPEEPIDVPVPGMVAGFDVRDYVWGEAEHFDNPQSIAIRPENMIASPAREEEEKQEEPEEAPVALEATMPPQELRNAEEERRQRALDRNLIAAVEEVVEQPQAVPIAVPAMNETLAELARLRLERATRSSSLRANEEEKKE
jgi:hypothetical protein